MYVESITDLLFYADKWNIGFAAQTIADLVETRKLKQVSWLAEPSSYFAADPFVVTIDGIPYVYYEYFNFWEGRGRICQITDFNFSTSKPVQGFVPAAIHLSYPYIFTEDGKICCIPETAEANEIALYDINPDQPALLSKRKTLITGAPYLDSSIIKFNGMYWLFTSKKNRPGEYLIFYAETLDASFLPHAMNPVSCDKKTFRGAGSLFTDNGILYRPTQNLQHAYGASIIINKINRLTTRVVESEFVFEITPQAAYPAGVHNISFTKDLIVIDGKRKVYSPIMPVKKLNSKLKYLLRKICN